MSIAYEYIQPYDSYGANVYNNWLNIMTRRGTDYEGLATSLNRSVFPPPSLTSMSDPDNTWVNYRWYLDLKGRSTLPQLSGDSVISWNPLETTYVRVTVISEFLFYNSKAKPCATESKYECEWRHRVSQIHQKCGCWPSSLIFAANSTLSPRCEVNLSAAYKGIPAVGLCKGNLNFSLNCPSECQLLSYEKGNLESSYWQIPLLRYPLYHLLPSGFFELTLETSNQRLVITESLYKDWTTFAAEFGGSIGTWLGR